MIHRFRILLQLANRQNHPKIIIKKVIKLLQICKKMSRRTKILQAIGLGATQELLAQLVPVEFQDLEATVDQLCLHHSLIEIGVKALLNSLLLKIVKDLTFVFLERRCFSKKKK